MNPYVVAFIDRFDSTLQLLFLNFILVAGEWGSWGNWSSCDGDCRNKRVWNRTRDCFKNGDLQDRIDRTYCVGSFIEYDQCKCEGMISCFRHLNILCNKNL